MERVLVSTITEQILITFNFIWKSYYYPIVWGEGRPNSLKPEVLVEVFSLLPHHNFPQPHTQNKERLLYFVFFCSLVTRENK